MDSGIITMFPSPQTNALVELIGMFSIKLIANRRFRYSSCFICSEIINAMVKSKEYENYFKDLQPAFDGRRNFYSRDPLPVGSDPIELEVALPGEGRDRTFKVAIRYVSEVSLFTLEDALQGRSKRIPPDAVASLDVILRHQHSML